MDLFSPPNSARRLRRNVPSTRWCRRQASLSESKSVRDERGWSAEEAVPVGNDASRWRALPQEKEVFHNNRGESHNCCLCVLPLIPSKLESQPCSLTYLIIHLARDSQDHHAPFVWKDRLPYPLKHGVFTRCVSPRRAKQTNGRGWMTSCAAPRRLNKRRRAGVPREDDRDNRNLESLLNSARLASMLDKRNVNLYRRRSSDFFDDFDDPAITSDTVDEGGFHSLIAPTQSLHQPTGVPLPTSTAVSTSPTARFSHESGLRSVASGRAESPTAVFSLSISAAKTKTATKKRSRRSNEEPPPEPIEVSSDESDGEGGRWTPAAPLKRIGTVQIQDDDIASLQPQCWLTGQVIELSTAPPEQESQSLVCFTCRPVEISTRIFWAIRSHSSRIR